jgi:putative acetyltransferase
MISIINYEDKYEVNFRQLNLEWLNKYNLAETHDLMILDNPRKTIIDSGGFIYLARHGEEIVGSAAIMKEQDFEYELVKMAVAHEHQGKGISKLLLEKCINKAKEIGVKKLMLFSNSQLQTAIKLYSKYGFYHVPAINSPYGSADVKMELEL